MVQVLLATEKAFSSVAVSLIESELNKANFELIKLENYKSRSDLLNAVSTVDAAIVRSDKCDAEFFRSAKNLKLLVRAGTGVDTIDLIEATNRNVVVMNTPGQNSNAVAELAFGLILYHIRSHFDGGMGTELRTRSLGLHGCGAVSRYMIQIAKGFGMNVKAFDPFLSKEQIEAAGAICAHSLEELYKSDIVSLHIPLTDETRNSIGKNLLTLFPRSGILVNTARQEIINEPELLGHLAANPDFGYLADVVPENLQVLKSELGPEKFNKQVLVTPKKMGAQTNEANNNCAPAAARQIIGFFEKQEVKFQVNK